MNPIFTLSVCAAISYSPTFLSLFLSSLSVVCVCVNISRRQTTRRKRNKKRTWLFHEMVNLMGIDSRLASQPAGNDFHLSAVPEFWRKPVFDSSKKKTNARQQQLSFLISKTTVQYSLFRDLYRVQNDDYSVSLIMPTNLSLSTGNVG